MLTESQLQRYSRQILLREVGGRGQQRLLDACVRIPRLDEGGRACAMWLARSGVGKLLLPEVADVASVRDWLRFQSPDVAFAGTPDIEAPPANDARDGARIALRIVRTLVASPLEAA